MKKEDILAPVISGIAGTSAMTAFSILISEKVNTQFKEHEILSDILHVMPVKRKHQNLIGWVGHFGAGIGFAFLNRVIQKKLKIQPGIFNGIGFGILDVIAGIAIWKSVFVFHKSPPDIHLRKYFFHLVYAHMIFGAISNECIRLLDNKNERRNILSTL